MMISLQGVDITNIEVEVVVLSRGQVKPHRVHPFSGIFEHSVWAEV